ncbi:hypothetical protein HETIRDRAFT_309297 [Heterobasidion irregulare TC 32-1]|uniref:tRNA-splicing endonuclease subunit Sen34 n=1 Tax=Heterobasidion irregulare (strain TC 32-1) TaxID=747525 RepID=W4KK95_HETIT|nr:uncharacterized protein HETIRDRAFT_309297 [Heterobasidion irregulare TC 32-1]ETW85471.1 hypothetical protein HETIRDRAFT_309297 [Heterobasidion irregulare TC 32-1]
MTTSNRIPIHVSNNRAFVWQVDHVAELRAKHHICGVLGGTLPHLSQQNVFLGLPLILMPEEVVLLVEKEFAVLVDDPEAHHAPSHDQLERWQAESTAEVRLQIARLQQEAGGKEGKAMSETAIRKRKEREERRRKAEELARQAAQNSPIDAELSAGQNLLTQVPAPSSPAPSSASPSNLPYTVTIPTTSDSLSWYAPEEHVHNTIDSARTAGVWSYPSNDEERAKCEVFRDLWEKGYYMGGGSKFGGDWLVYPGDPLRYHSHFAATVQSSPTAPMRPMEIVAHGRLGTATKKAHLLCGWNPESRKVTYLSVEWAGFG